MSSLNNAIFISYRRADLSQDQVNVIHEGLEKEFGDGSVFLDTSDIHSGAKWKEVLNQAGTGAKICLVMIGQRWLEKNTLGELRIKTEGDWVRKEIEYAIEKKLDIIPVLVNGSGLPKASDLPSSLTEMLESQTIRLDLENWSIYKEKFIKDLKMLLGASVVTNSSGLKKWWPVLLPLLAGLVYLFIRSIVASDANVVAGEECDPFESTAQLKTLIFPIISSQNERLEFTLEREFTKKCQKYQIHNDNNIAEFYRDKPATLSDQKTIARRCAADLFLSGQLVQWEHQSSFMADFGLIDDGLLVTNASAQDFSLSQSIMSLNDLTRGKAIDSLYENVLQYVLGLVAYRNKDFKKSLQIFKDLVPTQLQSDTMKTIIYQLMVDACIQVNQSDSALYYINKLSLLNPSDDAILLKTGLVAEKYQRPDIAIASYTRLIDSSQYNKNVLYEKRGDLYNNMQEYQKAKEDYKKVDPQQVPKERLDPKIRAVDTKIFQNRAAVEAITSPNNALVSDKIELSEKLLQLNQPARALDILQTIDPGDPQFNQAKAILLEAKFKLNPSAGTTIPQEILTARPNLKTAVEVQKIRQRVKN